eukprot:2155188-Rhodomonas_salina.4
MAGARGLWARARRIRTRDSGSGGAGACRSQSQRGSQSSILWARRCKSWRVAAWAVRSGTESKAASLAELRAQELRGARSALGPDAADHVALACMGCAAHSSRVTSTKVVWAHAQLDCLVESG